MELFHTGFDELRRPDIHFGRKNADFGQGFYLSPDRAFSERWARRRKGRKTVVNHYVLDTRGLTVKRFCRDGAWFDYIFGNRAGRADAFADADVIIGPIANDTIYNVSGVTTSGVLDRDTARRLLMLGPAYEQVALKTERAAAQLSWLSAREISDAEMARYREVLLREQEAFQLEFAEALENLLGDI